MIAGLSDADGLDYTNNANIENAKWVDFLWTETFPIGFYGPAVFPLLIAYTVTTVETVGDISGKFAAVSFLLFSHEGNVLNISCFLF